MNEWRINNNFAIFCLCNGIYILRGYGFQQNNVVLKKNQLFCYCAAGAKQKQQQRRQRQRQVLSDASRRPFSKHSHTNIGALLQYFVFLSCFSLSRRTMAVYEMQKTYWKHLPFLRCSAVNISWFIVFLYLNFYSFFAIIFMQPFSQISFKELTIIFFYPCHSFCLLQMYFWFYLFIICMFKTILV